MHFTTLTIAALAASLASAQTLNIPARVGSVQRASNQLISANRDFGNAEFDSGVACDTGEGGLPVFRIADGVTISNLIIGPNQVDGKFNPHCFDKRVTNSFQVSTAWAVALSETFGSGMSAKVR